MRKFVTKINQHCRMANVTKADNGGLTITGWTPLLHWIQHQINKSTILFQ